MSNVSQRWGLCVWVILIGVEPTFLFNQIAIADTTPPAVPQVTSVLTSGAGTSAGSAFANIIGSCFNIPIPAQMANGMNSGMGMGMGMGGSPAAAMGLSCPTAAQFSINSICPGSDQVPRITMDCSSMSPMATQQATAMLKNAYCTIQCEENKAQAIQQELKCIQSMGQSLTAQASSLTGLYQSAIQLAQKQVMAYTQAFQDDATKATQIGQILSGGDQGGSPGGTGGLLAMKAQTQQALAAMPQEIQQIQNDQKNYIQNQNTLNSFIQTRTAGLMSNCFNNQPIASYQCVPNGPPVTAAAYLQCRYEQSKVIGSNGMVQVNNIVQGQAQAGSQALAALIGQIQANMPTSSTAAIPTGANDLASGNTNNSFLISTPTDVTTYYGAQLSNYSIGSVNASTFVSGVMNYCYNMAVNTVSSEKSNAGSAIGVQLNNLQTLQNNVNAEITQEYQKFSQLYSDNMGALSGQSLPMNAAACVSGPTQNRINCLQNVQTEMQGLLVGTAPDSAMTLQIRGNNPATYNTIRCNGINGCITALQNGQRNIKADQATLTSTSQKYVLQQNQQIENFTKTMASQMSIQSSMINQQINSLNQALTSLGGQPLQVRPIQGEQLQKDSTGLYVAPRNSLNAIASFVQPPLPDLNNSMFLAGAGSATANVNAKYAQVTQELIQIQTQLPACNAQRQQAILQDMIGISPSGCYQDQMICQNGGPSARLQQALSEVKQAVGQNSFNLQGSMASLSSVAQSACEDPFHGAAAEGAQRMQTAARGCRAFLSSLMSQKGILQSGQNQSSGPGSQSMGGW